MNRRRRKKRYTKFVSNFKTLSGGLDITDKETEVVLGRQQGKTLHTGYLYKVAQGRKVATKALQLRASLVKI